MEREVYDILKKYWGYEQFRPMQREIIESVLAGRDTLALMPTGGGKSLTYQLPALLRDGLCIVITPLIALMKDQVDSLRRRGISAVAVHSGMSSRQIDIALDNCAYGDVKILYLAPERLGTEVFRLRVQHMNVSLLAVDEAHCISQWGYDFRPSYLEIASLRHLIPDTPVLALTASATAKVVEDIMFRLEFAAPNIFRTTFSRPNLSYVVRHTDDKRGMLMRVIRGVAGSGIVYARKREGVEKIADFLQQNGESVTFYHGGLPSAERSARQEEWISGKTRIMVATNAFGMGIDKADVRFVVHFTMCDSLENYYQEAGRAGRDGKRAYAVLLVAPDDERNVRRRIKQSFPKIELIKSIYERVCSYLRVAIGDGHYSSFVFNLSDFCSHERLFEGTVVGALKILQQNGYLTYIENGENPSRIMFTVSRDELYNVRIRKPQLELLLLTLLRRYDGLFTEFRAIDEMQIATICEMTPEEVHDMLRVMWRMHLISYIPSNHSPMIYFNEERLPTADLYISPATYADRKQMMLDRFERMLEYAAEQTECRSRILELYFGDTEALPCGVCDNCLKNKAAVEIDEAEILAKIDEGVFTVKALTDCFHCNPDFVGRAVNRMVAEGKLRITGFGEISRC